MILIYSLAKIDPDVWGSLTKNLEKYGMKKNLAEKVVKSMQNKFGVTPSPTEIKTFMS